MSEQGIYLLAQGLQQVSDNWPVVFWTRQGEIGRCRLGSLPAGFAGEPTVLVLPMEMLGSAQVPGLPGRRPSREALGYALEEQLAAPLEMLHLAYAPAGRQGPRRALVIERERLHAVLALLHGQGIDPLAIHADADRLFDQAGALWLEGRWLVGGAGQPLLAVSAPAVAGLAPLLPAMPWLAEDLAQAPCNEQLDNAMALLVRGRSAAIDLRQGDFRRRRADIPWQPALAVALVAWLMVCLADQLRADWLEQRTARLHAENLQQVQRWVPGQAPVGDLAPWVEALQQRPPPTTQVQQLAKLGEQLVQTGNLRLERVERALGQGWRLEVVGQRFDDLERLRERLPGLVMGQARQAEQGVQASLTWAGDQ
ncbi:hypothetical protein KSS94_25245 [Pseudomonas fakonensis]|uniref:GspL cytoplasmic actin-ATPase-like domain-containing protein n=1 Tax=Pseudomonas fakonensis TaxID=2842355 RepID=A0ABX8N4D0_9PSED|nr:type II secretion system protein GspL [Pseudomonas fakonensis]QXH51203.1 hypothetical protein KSS94_25245 [Pseudomonas fakonensis]